VSAAGLRLAAWVGNCIDPAMPVRHDNVATLRSRLPAPCLGVVPWLAGAPQPPAVASALDIAPLWSRP
jgi:dethiobiotin synthetase